MSLKELTVCLSVCLFLFMYIVCMHSGGEEREFEVYKADIETPGFRDYHRRLQTFILFFIDAASFIDDDDDKWMFYLL